MAERLNTDICVIGAGSGGLSVAYVASQMGAPTVLIEKGEMGGDCLNYGCVPSKALLAAAHAADRARKAARFGVAAGEPAIDAEAVFGHVRSAIAAIAPVDSQERYEGLGVTVLRAPARFVSPKEVEAGEARITARRFVIATGSSPAVPPIEGLADVPYLTNETVWELDAVPAHLIVIGGGPIGVEMAQAFRHLGARVTVLEMTRLLPADDADLADVIRRRLGGDGVEIREGVAVSKVEPAAGGVRVTADGAALEGSHLLIAAGRRPNLDGLGLDAAGIDHSAKGVIVDARLRTTNRRVFAVGDAAGGPQFTHVASYHAGVVIRNTLLRWPAKTDLRALPWVTYTDPELAQVGLTETAARARYGDVRTATFPFAENDRAIAEGRTAGFAKVTVRGRGTILGAGIVGPRAGELIQVWGLAIQSGLKIGKVAATIAPYPSFGEINKRAAGAYFTPALFGPRVRKLVQFLRGFG